jgi:hypothetical protein
MTAYATAGPVTCRKYSRWLRLGLIWRHMSQCCIAKCRNTGHAIIYFFLNYTVMRFRRLYRFSQWPFCFSPLPLPHSPFPDSPTMNINIINSHADPRCRSKVYMDGDTYFQVISPLEILTK